MGIKEKENWNKKYPEGKAFLSWNLSDYLAFDLEPPQSVMSGVTEGQAMEEKDVEEWAKEEITSLSILKESYPNKFEEHYQNYVRDLEYLASLDKISQEELKKLKKKENFNFGREE